MKFDKIIKLLATFIVITQLVVAISYAAPNIVDDAPPADPNASYIPVTADNLQDMTAGSAILVDAVSGRILYAKNPDTPHYPASTTKILTALLAVENSKPSDIVEIDKRAVGQDGSAIYVSEGDKMTMGNLLQATMLASGNDGAMAIAYYIGKGSLEKFVSMMNERAKELGATHTHFTNPHGLPDKNHYTTARDLALIALHAYQNPWFRQVVSTKQKDIPWVEPAGHHAEFFSTNHLLWDYDDVTGIKTGYTNEAGGCLVASAHQKDTTLISVVLQTSDSRNRFTESRALLDYGFKHIVKRENVPKDKLTTKIFVHDSSLSRVEVAPVEDFSYPLLEGESPEQFTYHLDLPKYLNGPVAKGTIVGKVLLFKDGQQVGQMNLVTQEDAPSGFSILGFLHKLFFS